MEMENQNNFKMCSTCYVNLPLTEYKLKRDLTPYKTCQNCIRIRKKEYDNNKAKRVCEHNLYKYYCSICTKARREKNLTKVQDLEKKLLYKAISEKLVEFVAQQRQL
jgi:hypothetical protein